MALHDDNVIEHDIFVARGSRETVLRWRRVSGDGNCRLSVRPLLSGRDYHALHHDNPVFNFDARVCGGNVSWRPYAQLPVIAALTNGFYAQEIEWYRNFLYTEEKSRGLDDTEDLASPGVFSFDLVASEAVLVLRADDDLEGVAGPRAVRPCGQTRQRVALQPSRFIRLPYATKLRVAVVAR